jgi:hypothetical protein
MQESWDMVNEYCTNEAAPGIHEVRKPKVGDLHKMEPFEKKKRIPGLFDNEVEFGESLVQKFSDIKCEHNLIKIG